MVYEEPLYVVDFEQTVSAISYTFQTRLQQSVEEDCVVKVRSGICGVYEKSSKENKVGIVDLNCYNINIGYM
ncbi:hypothetical protein M0804_008975 [Polistes exclamans]|nr:hypothetical protein M0804_008975 [Polistes exclamans]